MPIPLRVPVLLVLALAAPLAADPVEIPLGGKAPLPGGGTVLFLEVTEDSRCPKGAQCKWEGQAVMRLSVEGKGGTEAVQLATRPPEKTAATAGGHRLALRELKPYPGDGAPDRTYRLVLELADPGAKP